MKLAIVTRADASIKEMTDITHPRIKKFAKKWESEFVIISKDSDCTVGNGRTHYRVMEIYNLLESYDRIIHIDSDVLIMPSCPNPFDVVPEDMVGSIYEDKGTRAKDRRQRIQKAQQKFGKIGWEKGYINIGVFVVSKMHRPIFQKIKGEYYTDWGFADVLFGYQINKHNFRVCELPYRFNHMTMFSEKWNGSPDRFKSHIIHYAGKGVFDKGTTRIEQIRRDYKRVTD